MDVGTAKLESLVGLVDAHEHLNYTVKISTAGLATMGRLADSPSGDALLGALVDVAEMPWPYETRIPEPVAKIEAAKSGLAEMALTEALSSFDWYLQHLVTDLCQFSPRLRRSTFDHAHADPGSYRPADPPEMMTCCRRYAEQFASNHRMYERVEILTDELEIEDPTLEGLLPLFHYFRSVRNSLVHAGGLANAELSRHSASDALDASIELWDDLTNEPAPELPRLGRGERVRMEVPHAILFSALCHRVGRRLNEHVVEELGEEGFCHMAAWHALLSSDHAGRREEHLEAIRPVNFYLSDRYAVEQVSAEEVISYLQSRSLWGHCLERFEIVYGASDPYRSLEG